MLSYLIELQKTIKATNWVAIEGLLAALQRARATDTTVFVCGNGGSHAVALHWGVDLLKLAHINIYTLGTNMSLASALSNDLDYSVMLSTEMVTRTHPGDVLVALSCSGTSSNIKSVLREAHKLRVTPYLLTSPKAPEYPGVHTIRIQSNDYGILEDTFSAVGHYLTRELCNES